MEIDFTRHDQFMLDITPEIAGEMLKRNVNNRTLRQRTVQFYADAMRNGHWDDNGEAICFGKDGRLLNGQHRLTAVVLSGCTVRMLVCTGRDSSLHIDEGVSRSLRDRFMIAGIDDDDTHIKGDPLAIATARFAIMLTNPKFTNSTIPAEDVLDWMDRHMTALKVLLSLPKTNRLRTRNAPIGLAVVSAFEGGVDADFIELWYSEVTSGLIEAQKDISALLFREFILNKAIKGGVCTSFTVKKECLYKAQNSIRAFVAGEVLSQLKQKECYKIPQ